MNSNQSLDTIKVGDITPTKFGIDLIAEGILEQVREGELNSLEVAIKMNAMEQLTKSVKEKLLNDVLDELGKYPKGKAEINGATVSVMDSIKYDYSHIPEWVQLDEQIAVLKEKQKEIEDNEKKYHRGDLPVKSASSTFKIQLNK